MLQDLLSAHKGAFKGHTELRAQVNVGQRVSMVAGNMMGNSRSAEAGVSARVYRGGTYGFASSARYSDEGVRNVLAAAAENAAFMDSRRGKGMPPLPSVPAGRVAPRIAPRAPVPQELLADFARALDEIVAKRYGNLSSRAVSISCLDIEKLLAVSDGTDAHSFQPRATVYVTMTADTPDGDPVELFKSFGGLGSFDTLFSDPSLLLPELDALHKMLMDKRAGMFPEAGIRTCVLHQDITGMLAHEAVGHTVEADFVLAGSVAAHNLGRRVASDLVSMTDFAHTAFGEPCPLPVYVDDEGVPAEDAVLIENGILRGYMHSRESASHFGVRPQGNARAFEFSDDPLIRMRNTAILPGKDRLEDMIAGVDDGFFLLKTGNGQADANGEFMFSIEMGYEIKGGKIGRAIRETTISGVAFDMLKTVDMVSGDVSWDANGMCGKGQAMTTADGGPALRCKLNVGGR